MSKKITFSIISLGVSTLVLSAMPFVASAAVPTITSLSPSSAAAGGPSFTLTVNGTHFTPNSLIYVNNLPRTTAYTSSTQLTTSIPAADIANSGTLSITVLNTGTDGGSSNAQTLTVGSGTQSQNPVPAISSIVPPSKSRGDSAFTLTVNGSNFTQTSFIRFANAAKTTTYLSANQLIANIPASDLASQGTFQVTVVNPAPGGGTSNSIAFIVLPQGTTPTPSPTPGTTTPNFPNTGFGPSNPDSQASPSSWNALLFFGLAFSVTSLFGLMIAASRASV